MVTDSESIQHKIRSVDPQHPQPHFINEAVNRMKSGGVILFPTTQLYGLGADAYNPGAVSKVFNMKRRPPGKPLLILIESIAQLRMLVTAIPRNAEKIIHTFWPGKVTLILEAGKTVPAFLTAGTGKLGVRIPGHPVASALVREMRGPITGTSANLSGLPGCRTIDLLDSRLAGDVDLILDAGELACGIGSTVVDLTTERPEIIREGRVPAGEIFKCLER